VRTAGRWLLGGWLVAALVLLGIDGRLPQFLAGAAAGSLLVGSRAQACSGCQV
jgi:hypothetical protein